jgi:hypothetical protein
MNSIMAHINARRPAFFPQPTLSFFTAVQTIFEHTSGAFGSHAALKNSFPRAESQLRNLVTGSQVTIRKTVFPQLWRTSSVWAVSGCGTLDVDRMRAAQLQSALRRSLPVATTTRHSDIPLPLKARRVFNTLLSKKHPESVVTGDDKDYILLSHKRGENPDSPILPPWNTDYAAQRSRLDFVANLHEDDSSSFFENGVFVNNVTKVLHESGRLPDGETLKSMRAGSNAKTHELITYEVMIAQTEEPTRLLRNKIENLMSEVAHTVEQEKACRKIRLPALEATNILQLTDRAAIPVFRTQMYKVMNKRAGPTELDQERALNILSVHSADTGIGYWMQPHLLDYVCDEHKRTSIHEWIKEPGVMHTNLHTGPNEYCKPLEPTQDTRSRFLIDFEGHKLIWTKGGHHIDWELDEEDEPLLPLTEVHQAERSVGFYSNMSGLTDVSVDESEADSSADDDEEEEDLQSSADEGRSGGEDEKEPKSAVPTNFNERQRDVYDNIDSGSGDVVAADIDDDDIFGDDPLIIRTPDSPYCLNTIAADSPRQRRCIGENLAAIARGDALATRRKNARHMAWAIPHRVFAPEHLGFGRFTGISYHYQNKLYAPDCNAPLAKEQPFVEYQDAIGLLNQFNIEHEAKILVYAKENSIEFSTT